MAVATRGDHLLELELDVGRCLSEKHTLPRGKAAIHRLDTFRVGTFHGFLGNTVVTGGRRQVTRRRVHGRERSVNAPALLGVSYRTSSVSASTRAGFDVAGPGPGSKEASSMSRRRPSCGSNIAKACRSSSSATVGATAATSRAARIKTSAAPSTSSPATVRSLGALRWPRLRIREFTDGLPPRRLYGRFMKSRWKLLAPIDPDQSYLALASRIPPKSVKSTWKLFRGSRAVADQLASAEGAVGFSLLARPLRKEYATISLWVDDAALDAFARSSAHGRLQHELAAEMGDTTFVRWTVPGSHGAPTWSEALARLEDPHQPATDAR